MNKKVVILGGGTFSHVRSHLSIAAPAFGTTAKRLEQLCRARFRNMDVELALTTMADSNSKLTTNEDISRYVDEIINDNTVKVVFFNVALCDFSGHIGDIDSGKYAQRLETKNGEITMTLTPEDKLISRIRKYRKDIFLVGFKTTTNATTQEQFSKGLNLLKKASCNLVIVNDTVTRSCFIITPEEGVYPEPEEFVGYDKYGIRDLCLVSAVNIAYHRSHLTFTRSTVVDGYPVSWNDERVPETLRTVVNWCIEKNAYKEFNGATTGHFAAKLEENQFLTSIRKTNFNEIDKYGMVLVETDGDDNVIAYGAKPSVGGQSQRIVFNKFDDCNCIVHFHCPLKENNRDEIPVVSQWQYECGSHQCGQNTANGLGKIGDLYCVMLDKHGPNIVFNSGIDPNVVIEFIEANFDLNKSTSGFEKVNLELTTNV